MARHSAETLGKTLSVTVIATRADLCAASRRIPGSVGPLDLCVLSHRSPIEHIENSVNPVDTGLARGRLLRLATTEVRLAGVKSLRKQHKSKNGWGPRLSAAFTRTAPPLRR